MDNVIRETNEPGDEPDRQLSDEDKSLIESVLLDRVDGPFEPWPENWAGEMKNRILRRAEARRIND